MDNQTDGNKEQYKLDTVNLKGVEIFEAGKWKGTDWTESDIDELIENHKAGVIEPYLNINHSDKASDEFKNALKAMSLGFVEGLRREGTKLVADFKQVPKTIGELIEAGALKKKSVEVFKRYYTAAGREYKNVLQAVTFHGADGVPAVNTLSDFVALYKGETLKESEKTNHEIDERCEAETYQNSDKEVIGMDQLTIDKAEFDRLKALEGELQKFKSYEPELEKLKAEKQNVESELEKLKADVVANQKAAIESEAAAYVASQIEAKKIMPASADLYKSQYIQFKNDEKLMAAFKADIETRMEMLPGQLTDNGESVAKIDYKNGDELNAAIEKRMATKKIDFKAAREEVFAELEKAGI
jgi:hypothetical protein